MKTRYVRNKKRANLLRNRGENIRWSALHGCWQWRPRFKCDECGRMTTNYPETPASFPGKCDPCVDRLVDRINAELDTYVVEIA